MTIQEEWIYPSIFIYQGEEHTLLWCTSNREISSKGDYFKTEINGTLYIAKNIQDAKEKFSDMSSNIFWSEVAIINFDKFWLSVKNLKPGKSASTKTCKILLDGWNFLEDLIRTIGQESDLLRLRTPILNKMYEKLFYGNNLPAITPEGKSYNPIFKRAEIATFRKEIKWVWNEFFPKNEFD
jgi:hypothetical protein